MIYPIIPYGDPVLRKVAKPIDFSSLDVLKLADDMFETMYAASGVGLAAPQIGMDIRMFVVDGRPMNEGEDEEDKDPTLVDFKKVFVNATILDETGEEWGFEEGCLSIPDVHETVHRKPVVLFKHQLLDGSWEEMQLDGLAARIFQHEYDHIEGVLFTDRLSALRKRLLQGRLGTIAKGLIQVGYRMKFPQAR